MTLGHCDREQRVAWLLVLGVLVSCAPSEPSPSLVQYFGPGPDTLPSAGSTGAESETVPADSAGTVTAGSLPTGAASMAGPANGLSAPSTSPPSPAATPDTPQTSQGPQSSQGPQGTGAEGSPTAAEASASNGDVIASPMAGVETDDGAGASDVVGSSTGGAADGPAPEAPAPMAPPPAELRVSITTATQRGRYAPINVGAIWVENAAGEWVYTLNFWNSELNSRHMARYNSVNGPAYVRNFFLRWVTEPPPDVVTSATLDEHQTHVGTWHLKDANGAAAPAGEYNVVIELTEEEGPGEVAEFPFTLGPVGMTWTPADTPYYKAIELVLQ